MNIDFIDTEYLTKIARALSDSYGIGAKIIAEKAILDMEKDGMQLAADAWRSVAVLIEDFQTYHIKSNFSIH